MKLKTTGQLWSFISGFVLLTVFSGCLKQTYPDNQDKVLRIDFSSQTITAESIDSAFLQLNIYGTSQEVREKLQRSGSGFTLDMNAMASAVYVGELILYAAPDSAGQRFQHYVPINFNIDVISAINLPAPLPKATPLWRKRIILESSDKTLEAYIPLDVTDPYFIIRRQAGSGWDSVQVVRSAFRVMSGNDQLVQTQTWSCSESCFSGNHIRNNQAFDYFSNYMKTMFWDHALTHISIRNSVTDNADVLEYNWEK